MVRVTCPNCGGDHPKWDCKRPATKSTDRKNMANPPPSAVVPAARVELADKAVSAKQAVDAIHKPIGRPRIHPDRKAYKAQHERERRAKLKASKGE